MKEFSALHCHNVVARASFSVKIPNVTDEAIYCTEKSSPEKKLYLSAFFLKWTLLLITAMGSAGALAGTMQDRWELLWHQVFNVPDHSAMFSIQATRQPDPDNFQD